MSFWNFITGTEPQEEQQAQTDAKKQAYEEALQRREAAGTITAEKAEAGRQYENGLYLEDVDAGAQAGFQEGLEEGYHNVLSAPGKAIGAVGKGAGELLGGVLKNIPWWAYLGAAAALFFYLSPILMPLISSAARRVAKR